jgi:hypothetical protein
VEILFKKNFAKSAASGYFCVTDLDRVEQTFIHSVKKKAYHGLDRDLRLKNRNNHANRRID